MELSVLPKALFIGFAMAVPMGPVGILCLRRALTQGSALGFCSGLGMATADAVYGGAAWVGLQLVWTVAQGHEGWLRAVGGLLLLAVAGRSLLCPPAKTGLPAKGIHLANAFISAFFLTLLNPTIVLSFAAFYAALNVPVLWGSPVTALPLVLGIFLGSALCGLLVSLAAGRLRERLSADLLAWSQRLAAWCIGAIGLLGILTFLW